MSKGFARRDSVRKSPSTGEVDGPVFYNGNGRNMGYKLQNADFMKSGFRHWTLQQEGCQECASGLGTVFTAVSNVHKTLSSMNALAPDYSPASEDHISSPTPTATTRPQRYDTLGRQVTPQHRGLYVEHGAVRVDRE